LDFKPDGDERETGIAAWRRGVERTLGLAGPERVPAVSA
jgi:hypothetical protein